MRTTTIHESEEKSLFFFKLKKVVFFVNFFFERTKCENSIQFDISGGLSL